MADAGRILIIPKGNYNAEITYEVLDLVFNNGNSWLCKKTTKGIDPSDSNAEYWYKFTNFDSIIKNNVTTSEEGFALDARQGKVLMEAINGVSARVTSLSESTTASVSDLDAKINEATNIAKGRNQARVFATTDAMKEWLKNAANKGMAKQGDNLYIVTKNVPDYWVAEVLDTPNNEGYYYEVEELETQKVDLTTLNAAVDQLTNDVADINGKLHEDDTLFNRSILNGSIKNPKLKTGIYTIGSEASDTPSGFDSAGILIAIRRSIYYTETAEMLYLHYIDAYGKSAHCVYFNGTWTQWI